MVNQQLIDPKSIVVVGASNNISKPGGKLLHNIRTGTFNGELFALNPKEDTVQGLKAYRAVQDLPDTDLAILAIPAHLCPEAVRELAETRNTKAFIVVSAGFSEEDEQGAAAEKELLGICKKHEAALIGPNCIGVMTPAYQGVFTLPIPRLDPSGCDFISGSGATAVFIMEAGLQKGLTFNQVFSVGNSAQLGVEDVLQYLDETYREGRSSKVKILYFETIKNPDKLLRHATSLRRKGCHLAAVKAGTTEAGSRAASSHTGAMASSDMAVDALFRKAGIVRCHGREDLTTVASVMLYPELKGKNLAIITHAGGPAVMLTDVLEKGNMTVPYLEGPEVEKLLTHLYPGSSASNPIDILATGNAQQVGICIDFCENSFSEIDGMVVIFGTPGLAPVFDVYEVLHEKMETCKKPIFPVLPSVTTAGEEVQVFLAHGHINFPDEVLFGEALTRIHNTPAPAGSKPYLEGVDIHSIRDLVEASDNGYLTPGEVSKFLDAAGIPRVTEYLVTDIPALEGAAREVGYPLVMKVIGPLHKSDVGGVVVGIDNDIDLMDRFRSLSSMDGVTGILIQPQVEGLELFAGAVYEPSYGHLIMCGLGGINVEVLKDLSTGLAPLSMAEATQMIRSLKGYPMLDGIRGQTGIETGAYAGLLVRLSGALRYATEVVELDFNPIIGKEKTLTVVDARIRVEKPVL
jgi:acetyltransferase